MKKRASKNSITFFITHKVEPIFRLTVEHPRLYRSLKIERAPLVSVYHQPVPATVYIYMYIFKLITLNIVPNVHILGKSKHLIVMVCRLIWQTY